MAASTTVVEEAAFLCDPRHRTRFLWDDDEEIEEHVPTWRLKDRMKTTSVALVLCLNIGTDPPDIIKTSPCARMECWLNPFAQSQLKSLEAIGAALQAQYNSLQSRAAYKQLLDPNADVLRKLGPSLKKRAPTDRALFHYNGHGVPRPTVSGEIWVFNKNFTQYLPFPVMGLRSTVVGSPAIYVFDCSGAGVLLPHFTDPPNPSFADTVGVHAPATSASPPPSSSPSTSPSLQDIVLVPCGAHEVLPMDPAYPADLFTACLTTPILTALRWFILTNPLTMKGVDPDVAGRISGKLNDRKTPLGELNWIFTAITDTIAWNTFPAALFQQLFRQDLLVASLFRNFLLADRIFRSLGCTPSSIPRVPVGTSQHPLWQAWDLAAESVITNYLKEAGPTRVDRSGSDPTVVSDDTPQTARIEVHPPAPNPFFAEQLTAFEVWLEFGSEESEPPEQLPIVLQVLLSQAHRLRALYLLRRFFDLGSWAVNLALSVGIFPYVLKLLQSPQGDLRQVLVYIWAKIIAFDRSCQQDLVSARLHVNFISHMTWGSVHHDQHAMAAFVLTTMCDGYPAGQKGCLEKNLHHNIHARLVGMEQQSQLSQGTAPSRGEQALLRRWLCLCMGELCRDYFDAKVAVVSQSCHEPLLKCLTDPCPEVRAAAVYALSNIFGVSNHSYPSSPTSGSDGEDDGQAGFMLDDGDDPASPPSPEDQLLRRLELEAVVILSSTIALDDTDGSPMVRRECALAFAMLSLIPSHKKNFRAAVESAQRSQVAMSSPAGGPGANVVQTFQAEPWMEPYLHWQRGLVQLLDDPFPVVREAAGWAMDMCEHSVGSDRFEEARMGLINARQHHSVYAWSRKQFAEAHQQAELDADPMSEAGANRLYWARRNELALRESRYLLNPESSSSPPAAPQSLTRLASEPEHSFMWRKSDKRGPKEPSGQSLSRASSWGDLTESSGMVLEQASIIETPTEMTSHLLFHPYEELLVAVDERCGLSLWQYREPRRAVQFLNDPDRGARVSSLNWVNEGGPSLLAVGSKDGVCRFWGGLWEDPPQAKLVTSFLAIEDIDQNESAVGMCTDYQKETGLIFAGGASRFLRCWDLQSEQCVCKWSSGSEAPVSSLHASSLSPVLPSTKSTTTGLLFAGYQDGSLRVFDPRLPSEKNMVQYWHEHGSWVVGVNSHTEHDIVSASLAGDVRIWDLRSVRSVKCIHVLHHQSNSQTSSSLSAFATHPFLPLMATGSDARFIKMLDSSGGTINTIKYQVGFFGERIGPISCLAFHPLKPILASGATDKIMSLYTLKGEF